MPSGVRRKFAITEKIGAIFEAPDNTLIIHACNCLGSWNAGIAKAFKQQYPRAFSVYKQHCDFNTPQSLIGTALLIPPMEPKGPKHFIGCLFTSKRYGKAKDSADQILANTGPAMEDLLKSFREYNKTEENTNKIAGIRMCQINSGLFAVPWEKSKAVIEDLEVDREGEDSSIPAEILVYSLPSVS